MFLVFFVNQSTVEALTARLQADATDGRATLQTLMTRIDDLLSDPDKHPELLVVARCKYAHSSIEWIFPLIFHDYYFIYFVHFIVFLCNFIIFFDLIVYSCLCLFVIIGTT